MNVFAYAFEYRATQFQAGVDFVQSSGKLEIECAVIFGQHLLPVGFFTHLNVRNGVTALLEIGDLGRRVFRCAEKHGDRNHRRQPSSVAAVVKEIQSNLLMLGGPEIQHYHQAIAVVVARIVYIGPVGHAIVNAPGAGISDGRALVMEAIARGTAGK